MATPYIGEFRNGVSSIGTTEPQIYPQPGLRDQTIALSGTSALSAPFGANTAAIIMMADEGCSIVFGTSSVVATTGNFLLQQGVPYFFGVQPGSYVAAIANSAGNSPGGGGGGGGNATIVGPLGQEAMANSVSVAIASNQTSLPVTPTPTSSATTTTAVTAGTSSNQGLASGTRKFLAISNESASAFVAFSLGGTAALNTSGSKTLAPMNSFTFDADFVPSDAINVIASAASTPVTIWSA